MNISYNGYYVMPKSEIERYNSQELHNLLIAINNAIAISKIGHNAIANSVIEAFSMEENEYVGPSPFMDYTNASSRELLKLEIEVSTTFGSISGDIVAELRKRISTMEDTSTRVEYELEKRQDNFFNWLTTGVNEYA